MKITQIPQFFLGGNNSNENIFGFSAIEAKGAEQNDKLIKIKIPSVVKIWKKRSIIKCDGENSKGLCATQYVGSSLLFC